MTEAELESAYREDDRWVLRVTLWVLKGFEVILFVGWFFGRW